MKQKEVKREEFYLTILNQIKSGSKPIDIAENLNISRQRLNYYIRTLKNKGFIEKKGYGVWDVKKDVKTFSLGTTKPITNLHALQIRFPILEGKILDKDWEIKEKLKNWLPKYKDLTILGGLTIKNNNNKSLTVWAKTRNIESLNEIDNLAFKIRSYIFEYFKNKHACILDVFNCEIKNLDIATEDKHAEGMRRKGEKFTLNLNKKAEKIFEKDNLDAEAHIDGTPFKFSAETNDKEWKRAYLSMPFMMKDIANATYYIAKNYESHVKLVEKASKVMERLDKKLGAKPRKIKNKLGSQLTLGDFNANN